MVSMARRQLSAEIIQSQQELIREARHVLGLTSQGLCDALGVSLHTINSWIATERAARHRNMPHPVRKLITIMVAQCAEGVSQKRTVPDCLKRKLKR